jgi:hypothetical protein
MTAWLLIFLVASTTPPKLSLKPLTAMSPCEVVTNLEVRQAFKHPFAKGTGDASSCEYSALDQQVVAIKLHHSTHKIDVQAEMLTLRKAFPDARMRDATGFANPAFFLDHPGIGTQLFVIRGEHDFLLVSVMGLGEAKRVAPGAKQIAKKALERLPTLP